jgi:hypothetical protein
MPVSPARHVRGLEKIGSGFASSPGRFVILISKYGRDGGLPGRIISSCRDCL